MKKYDTLTALIRQFSSLLFAFCNGYDHSSMKIICSDGVSLKPAMLNDDEGQAFFDQSENKSDISENVSETLDLCFEKFRFTPIHSNVTTLLQVDLNRANYDEMIYFVRDESKAILDPWHGSVTFYDHGFLDSEGEAVLHFESEAGDVLLEFKFQYH